MRAGMSCHSRWVSGVALLSLCLAIPSSAGAQGNPEPASFKFNSGQSVQPIFEGWAKNPDGSFAMYFGYFNRNYVEAMEVPVGPANKFEPGAIDRGQPTYLATRIHRKQFSVNVPKDWGRKELIWTLTSHDKTERAVGWLQPEWEIDPFFGGRVRTEESLRNKAPVMTLEAAPTASLSTPLQLVAIVKDDGLPTPQRGGARRGGAAVGQETPPTLKPLPDQPDIPTNVPAIAPAGGRGGAGAGGGAGRGAAGRGGAGGLAVSWMVWRGPANAEFQPATANTQDGKATFTVKFSKPGTYVLRANTTDGVLPDDKDVTVTVK